MKRVALFVLGMHRSGTSMISGSLSKIGFAPPTDPLPANAGNAKGYWESTSIVLFNEELLTALGSRWDDVWPLPDPEDREVTKAVVRRQAADILAAAFGDADRIVVKDPRICRLAPFWLDEEVAGGRQLMAVIPIRMVSAVASSLKRRDDFPSTYSYLLWLYHVIGAEKHTRNLPRSFVLSHDFVADWRNEWTRIQDQLGLGPSARDENQYREVDDFIDKDMFHTQEPEERLDDSLVRELAEATLDATRKLVIAPYDPAAMRTLDSIVLQLNALERTLGPLLAESAKRLRHSHAAETQRLEGLMQSQAAEIQSLRTQAAEIQSSRAQELQDLRAEINALSETLHDKVVAVEIEQAWRKEVQFHLDRLNSYGWTKIGLKFDRARQSLLRPLKFRLSQ